MWIQTSGSSGLGILHMKCVILLLQTKLIPILEWPDGRVLDDSTVIIDVFEEEWATEREPSVKLTISGFLLVALCCLRRVLSVSWWNYWKISSMSGLWKRRLIQDGGWVRLMEQVCVWVGGMNSPSLASSCCQYIIRDADMIWTVEFHAVFIINLFFIFSVC